MNRIFTLLVFIICLPINAQLIDFTTLERDSVIDVDGNVYPIILFDETWWMGTNLRTKHFNDGTEILQMTEVFSDASWSYWIGVPRWAYPALDSLNFDTYGLLYSWFAAADKEHGGVCPKGWSLTDTTDWFNLGKLIVGEENVVWDSGTRNTPQGGTETYYEINNIKNVGRFLKTDNGVLWDYAPAISSDCGAANMNIVPTGKLSTSISALGKLADYWTGVYVHSDSSGQGRRYLHFEYYSHSISVNWNHNANMQCARCIKHARILKPVSSSITLDSAANSADTIAVTANYNWQAQTNALWLTVTQSVDSADGEIITKTTSANTAYESRTDTVFVTMDDAKTKTILVTQAGKTPLFSILDTCLTVMALEGSTTPFSVSSNVDWTIGSSETWLTASVTSGIGNAAITLSAEANPDTITRSATITVESATADTLVEITVTQAAKDITVIPGVKVLDTDVLLYPNPVSRQLNILSGSEIQQVSIISLTGETVKAALQTNAVSMENLSPGLYLVKITTANGTTIKKVLKQ